MHDRSNVIRINMAGCSVQRMIKGLDMRGSFTRLSGKPFKSETYVLTSKGSEE